MNTGLIIIGVLMIIGGIAYIVFDTYVYEKQKKEYYEKNKYNMTKEEKEKYPQHKTNVKGKLTAIAGIILIIIANCFTIIPTGYTGVKTVFAQIKPETIPNGFNLKIPFVERIEKVNNKQQDITFEGQVWSETKARTAIYYDNITVTYQVDKGKSAWIYANVSNYKDNLVTKSLFASAIKSASKELSDEDATNRGKIEPLALQKIQTSFDEKYGENTIIINKVVIGNADFDESYNNAVAEKQNAQLAYEKQQIENQRLVEQAQAEADAKKIAAQGEADANEILTNSLSKDIFTQMMLEKWNGELPKVVGEGNAIFDISSMLNIQEQQE